jgi:hypothetical protein
VSQLKVNLNQKQEVTTEPKMAPPQHPPLLPSPASGTLPPVKEKRAIKFNDELRLWNTDQDENPRQMKWPWDYSKMKVIENHEIIRRRTQLKKL